MIAAVPSAINTPFLPPLLGLQALMAERRAERLLRAAAGEEPTAAAPAAPQLRPGRPRLADSLVRSLLAQQVLPTLASPVETRPNADPAPGAVPQAGAAPSAPLAAVSPRQAAAPVAAAERQAATAVDSPETRPPAGTPVADANPFGAPPVAADAPLPRPAAEAPAGDAPPAGRQSAPLTDNPPSPAPPVIRSDPAAADAAGPVPAAPLAATAPAEPPAPPAPPVAPTATTAPPASAATLPVAASNLADAAFVTSLINALIPPPPAPGQTPPAVVEGLPGIGAAPLPPPLPLGERAAIPQSTPLPTTGANVLARALSASDLAETGLPFLPTSATAPEDPRSLVNNLAEDLALESILRRPLATPQDALPPQVPFDEPTPLLTALPAEPADETALLAAELGAAEEAASAPPATAQTTADTAADDTAQSEPAPQPLPVAQFSPLIAQAMVHELAKRYLVPPTDLRLQDAIPGPMVRDFERQRVEPIPSVTPVPRVAWNLRV